MGSEVDHHQLTQERDQLRQQLAEANAARERAETDAAVLRVIVEKVEMLYFPYTGPGPTVAALIDEARTALASGAGEKERVEAWAAVMRTALEHYANPQHWGILDDDEACVHEITWYGDGDDGDVARAALASDAGTKAAAVLAAATAHVHWLWSYHGRHYEGGMPDERRLVAAVDAREKGEAECG